MTEVAFHFNAPDRLVYACRLLRKAYMKGARLLVLAEAPLAEELDRQLWTMAGTAFVPHCTALAPANVQARSPIVIRTDEPDSSPPQDVLVNLKDQMPGRYHGFSRVIEVVTEEASCRALARERWKAYKASGFEPRHLDLRAVSTASQG